MTDVLRKKIGARLRQAREDVGLTQEDVARLLGLTDVGYGAYERGQRLIPVDCLVKLTGILDRSVNYFLDSPPVDGLSPEEEELVRLYRAVTDLAIKESLIRIARATVPPRDN
jgi:transcriptional regulator with XRE-family HTH domain